MQSSHGQSDASSRWLKSTQWLADNLGKVVVVDASYYLSTQKRDAKAEYLAAPYSGRGVLRHQRDRRQFNRPAAHAAGAGPVRRQVGALGIAETDTIVVYDGIGLYSAPRVWWTFRIFGAKNVYMLDGGMPAWKAEDRPTEAGDGQTRRAKTFNAEMDTGAVAMRRRRADGAQQRQRAGGRRALGRALCRPRGRSRAPGLRRGHMPGAFNVPFDRDRRERPLARARQDRRRVQESRRRSRQADHHQLRLRRHRRRSWRSGSTRSASSWPRSTTAPGRNGAAGRTCRS